MKLSSTLLPVAAVAISVAIALAVFGLRIANPLDTGWIFGDMISTQFGWHEYQTDPKHLYPMVSDRYSWPVPMPVAMFDPIPIVALIMKLLAPVLPAPFQYLGPLFLVSVALQALLAWALLREATPGKSGASYSMSLLIGSLLFAAAPILLIRFYYTHAPLVVQWPLLLSLLVYMRSFRFGFARNVRDFSLVTFLAGSINPYVMAMTAVIYGGYIVRMLRERSLEWQRYLLLLIPLETGLAGLLAFGFLGFNGSEVLGSAGLGFYSANFLSPIDPLSQHMGSQFIPDWQARTPGQYEGFGYAGLGVLLLIVAGIAVHFMQRRKATVGGPADETTVPAQPGSAIGQFLPLAVVIAVAYVIAMSHVMAFGTFVVELPVPDVVLAVMSNFRSSGRFIWVVIYTAMLISFAVLIRQLESRRAALLFGAAAALQIADLAGPLALMHDHFRDRFLFRGAVEKFHDPAYAGLGAAHDRILIVPPWQCRGWQVKGEHYPGEMFMKFSNLAVDSNLPINSFYAGRTPVDQVDYHCETFPAKLAAAPADRRSVYILSRHAFVRFGGHIAATHRCDFADDMFLCRGDPAAPGLTARARSVAANPPPPLAKPDPPEAKP